MSIIGVVGAQWGDEGKGKVIDLLAKQAEVVVRGHGGNNAGHTVVNEQGKFALHLVPAGIFNPATVCVVGPGVVLDASILLEELDALNQRGVSTSGLVISNRAHLVMPYHLIFDQALEESRGAGRIGTTGRGIGPAYADKVARDGLRTGDLLNLDRLRGKLEKVLAQKNALLTRVYGREPFDLDKMMDMCARVGSRLAPYIRETEPIVSAAVRQKMNVLLEGAHGTMLDPDHGTYPYVTSSSPTIAGLCLGAGVPPTKVDTAIGVYKAYSTRVGGGPMPTELSDGVGELIRERGNEFGTTTGRARRCGWFDAVSGRHSARINGFDSLALTKMDVLDTLEEIKICVAYRLDGLEIDFVPADPDTLARCEPVYESHAGWGSSISMATSMDGLPAAARKYLARLQELLEVEVDLIGVGASRNEVIRRRELW